MAIAGALHDEENKQKSVRFLEALTEILDAEMRKKRTKEVAHSFSAVSRAASYARDIGASMKTLLEYAVLSLPE